MIQPRKADYARAFWYWPYWTEIRKYPAALQPINLFDQSIVTTDLKNFIFDMTASIQVADPISATLNTVDVDGQVCVEISRCAIELFAGKSLQECIDLIHGGGIDTLRGMANDSLKFIGVRIACMAFGQFSVSYSIKHWTPPQMMPLK